MSTSFYINNVIKTGAGSYLGYKLLVFGFHLKSGWRLEKINNKNTSNIFHSPSPGVYGGGINSISPLDVVNFQPVLTIDNLNYIFLQMQNDGLNGLHLVSLLLNEEWKSNTYLISEILSDWPQTYLNGWKYFLVACRVNEATGTPISSGEGESGAYGGLTPNILLTINDDEVLDGDLQIIYPKLWGLPIKANCTDALLPLDFPSPINY